MSTRFVDREEGQCLEYHCVHNDGPVFVDATLVGGVRLVKDPKLGDYTRLHMNGMADIEIREPYEQVVEDVWGEIDGKAK